MAKDSTRWFRFLSLGATEKHFTRVIQGVHLDFSSKHPCSMGASARLVLRGLFVGLTD